MVNTERVHCLILRWQSALNQRKFHSQWEPSQAFRSVIHLIETFPETPVLEIMDWVTSTIENGQGPSTFGDMADVASPMELIRNDYRGFRLASALCPIRC